MVSVLALYKIGMTRTAANIPPIVLPMGMRRKVKSPLNDTCGSPTKLPALREVATIETVTAHQGMFRLPRKKERSSFCFRDK